MPQMQITTTDDPFYPYRVSVPDAKKDLLTVADIDDWCKAQWGESILNPHTTWTMDFIGWKFIHESHAHELMLAWGGS